MQLVYSRRARQSDLLARLTTVRLRRDWGVRPHLLRVKLQLMAGSAYKP